MKTNKKGFTLIELLVVITIIGILAGLAVPAINGGLDRAKQTADISNIRNVGILLFAAANDNDGSYPTVGAGGDSSVKDIFVDLIRSRAISDGKVLSSQGYTATVGNDTTTGNPTVNGTIAWGYGGDGLTTSDDDRYVLLCSRGYQGTSVSAETITLVAGAKSWKLKGLAVYTKGNAARFSSAGKGKTASNAAVGNNAALFGGGSSSETTATIQDPSEGS